MTGLLALGAAIVLGVGVPWLGIRMLVPTLSEGHKVPNYRGQSVFLGLGIAWLVWAGAAIVGGTLIGGYLLATPSGVDGGSVAQVLTLAGPLALVAFALGIVDDAYGSPDARGFRGHLRALTRGRLTTGGLKLVGISAASLVVGLVLAGVSPWVDADAAHLGPARIAAAVLAGAAIALTSNFVNLVDLRPGRALKVYCVLGVAGVLSTALLMPWLADLVAAPLSPSARAIDVGVLLAFVLGPVVATWSYDLGERGMLGDAGANPMGAVAGMLIVAGLPLWGLGAYAALMFALNIASERVSFSRVIENSRGLSRLDGIGRARAARSSVSSAD